MPDVSLWDALAFDKFGHLSFFAFFTLFLKTGLKRQTAFSNVRQRSTRFTMLIALPYGGVLELVQGTVSPDRTSDVLDFAANAAGCFIGIVIFRLIYGRS